MQETKYILTGFDISTYCKITSVLDKGEMSYTISFGGKSYYCIIISITPDKPDEAYIDRVESNETCITGGEGSTKDLLKTALWTIKLKFPFITKVTFKDDSHIECSKGIKTHKLNLAYDYILKCNKTWYQFHFKAQLPVAFNTNYTNSLHILDEPVQNYEIIKNRLPELQKYKSEYETAKSPRDFIQKLRDKYEKTYLLVSSARQEAMPVPSSARNGYCHEVSRWLSRYMEAIKVNIFASEWYIEVDDIPEPPKYSIHETNEKLRGAMKQAKRFTFGPFEGGYCIGSYDTID